MERIAAPDALRRGLTNHEYMNRGLSMKITTVFAIAIGLGSLAACNKSATEANADNIEANADNSANTIEANGANVAANVEANAGNTADAVRNAGDNTADAVRNADGNTH